MDRLPPAVSEPTPSTPVARAVAVPLPTAVVLPPTVLVMVTVSLAHRSVALPPAPSTGVTTWCVARHIGSLSIGVAAGLLRQISDVAGQVGGGAHPPRVGDQLG